MGAKEEAIARLTQKSIEQLGTELSYITGNATAGALNYADQFGQITGGIVAMESARAIGTTAFKAGEDIIRNDKICAGACLVATACEVVAWSSAMIKYPGAMKVYFVSKSISVGCIRFRDLCRNAKGGITSC